jgi:hypothetical protein
MKSPSSIVSAFLPCICCRMRTIEFVGRLGRTVVPVEPWRASETELQGVVVTLSTVRRSSGNKSPCTRRRPEQAQRGDLLGIAGVSGNDLDSTFSFPVSLHDSTKAELFPSRPTTRVGLGRFCERSVTSFIRARKRFFGPLQTEEAPVSVEGLWRVHVF